MVEFLQADVHRLLVQRGLLGDAKAQANRLELRPCFWQYSRSCGKTSLCTASRSATRSSLSPMFDESVVTGGYLIRPRTKNGRFLPFPQNRGAMIEY